jgi:hypothetical protein
MRVLDVLVWKGMKMWKEMGLFLMGFYRVHHYDGDVVGETTRVGDVGETTRRFDKLLFKYPNIGAYFFESFFSSSISEPLYETNPILPCICTRCIFIIQLNIMFIFQQS